jgi:T5orf172 domain
VNAHPDLLAPLRLTRTTPRHQPGAVYLLPHRNRERFKVGWSLQPMQRVQRLPEYRAHLLDLRSAQVAWFDQARRAREVERALHRNLAPYGFDAGHHGTGHTEWFAIQGLVLARRMLSMLPAGDGEPCRARLRPLDELPPPTLWAPTVPMEEGALDAWHRVEDLWLRLAALAALGSSFDGEQRSLLGLDLKRHHSPGIELLRIRAVNLDTYTWFDDGQRRTLVTMLEWEGEHLVAHLMPARQLKRWCEGELVDGMLREFLARHTTRLSTAARRAPTPTAWCPAPRRCGAST